MGGLSEEGSHQLDLGKQGMAGYKPLATQDERGGQTDPGGVN